MPTSYVSLTPNAQGFVDYSQQDHETWGILYRRQLEIIRHRACDEFLQGLEILNMGAEEIPQIPDLNKKLGELTGWGVEPVPALIGFEKFFDLLANRRFPAATFIRRREELDYLKEPDIFHEYFGHCPLLTNQAYADFSQRYGELGLAASKKDRVMLARLYWFTIEFGLLRTDDGLKIYGGGILSSKEECQYSLQSDIPVRQDLSVVEAFRTHYRIDQLQRSYFILNDLSDLQTIKDLDLTAMIAEARRWGMKPSPYPPKEEAAC